MTIGSLIHPQTLQTCRLARRANNGSRAFVCDKNEEIRTRCDLCVLLEATTKAPFHLAHAQREVGREGRKRREQKKGRREEKREARKRARWKASAGGPSPGLVYPPLRQTIFAGGILATVSTSRHDWRQQRFLQFKKYCEPLRVLGLCATRSLMEPQSFLLSSPP